jgi:hypothetical protein
VNFGQALDVLKAGGKVMRDGWNGRGMSLTIQRPDAHSKMSFSYIFISTGDGHRVPWLASRADMLSEDWQAVP